MLSARHGSIRTQWCCWWSTFTGRIFMAKKSSVSSQSEKPVSVSSEDIKNRKWTEREKAAIRRGAARQASSDDSGINYSDIPPLTDEQLAAMVRFRDRHPKVQVSVRIETRVLDWLKSKGEGHLTRINDILANVMEAEQRAQSRRA